MTSPGGQDTPKITVLLPVYNSAPYLHQAVDSILGQSRTDFELLAIDDGSTDGSLGILRSYMDPRMRILAHPRNQGLITTLNEGIGLARGEYIARMDADDVMLPERLAEQASFLDSDPSIAVVAGFVDFINAEGSITGTWGSDRATPDEASVAAMLPRTNCIAHPSVMIRRSALARLRYDPRQTGTEDWDLWLRMRSRGWRIAKLPKVLLHYRIHAASAMAGEKRTIPYERRLLRTRHRFLTGEWARGRITPLHLAVLKAQGRTLARHLRNNVATPFLRDIYRVFTYSPFKLLRERWELTKGMNTWQGQHVFTFPYLGTGGAERVHGDILNTVTDMAPLILIEGFSKDRTFAPEYARAGTLLEIPRVVHHPLTRRWALHRLAAGMKNRKGLVLFGSNSRLFFDLLPHVDRNARAVQLIHAFLYQPHGNRMHREWLPFFPRVGKYLFVSGHAMAEFKKFLFANNVVEEPGKLEFIANAVHRSGHVREHQRTGLLFVGRDSPEKRLGLFLELADRLERENPGRFRFTVVGSDTMAGHPQVVFKGTETDPDAMAENYGTHDLLVLTSLREGFPMVVMEAMANGVVVLATPVGDIPNRLEPSFAVVSSSVDGHVVLEEMAHAATRLDNHREQLQHMKALALERALQEFNLARFNKRYRDLLTKPAS
ncbi:MAG: glycosyltransferase [Bacteroidetes bacterium]|nr:glycosyltransferase [Bacteroidota bacterium]MBS1944368.1 glycosyltransferase [Bacteroidota bacterium]